MTITELSALALKASLPGLVFATGLAATRHESTWLLREPGLFLRSMLSMNVIAPLFAIALAVALPLDTPVKIALVMLAVSPVPPILPKKALKAGGAASFMVSLLVTAAVLSIVVIPLTLQLLGRALGLPLGIAPTAIATQVAASVIVPLALGIVVHTLAPGSSVKASRFIGGVATVLLILGVLPLIYRSLPAFRILVGDGTLMVIVSFVVGALLTGHLLGGPDRDNRTVLALSTASRHPGIAIALATANFPAQRLAVPAVLLFVIVSAIVTTPYAKLSRRRHDAPDARPATRPRASETPSRQR